MNWHVTDASERDNDGVTASFDVTLYNPYTHQIQTVGIKYTLLTDKYEVPHTLSHAQLAALADDAEMRSDIREAVMAERDARREQAEEDLKAVTRIKQREIKVVTAKKLALN